MKRHFAITLFPSRRNASKTPPYGGVPRDLRLNFAWRHRHELEAAVQTMLS
jgi:hypothetical protein